MDLDWEIVVREAVPYCKCAASSAAHTTPVGALLACTSQEVLFDLSSFIVYAAIAHFYFGNSAQTGLDTGINTLRIQRKLMDLRHTNRSRRRLGIAAKQQSPEECSTTPRDDATQGSLVSAKSQSSTANQASDSYSIPDLPPRIPAYPVDATRDTFLHAHRPSTHRLVGNRFRFTLCRIGRLAYCQLRLLEMRASAMLLLYGVGQLMDQKLLACGRRGRIQ